MSSSEPNDLRRIESLERSNRFWKTIALGLLTCLLLGLAYTFILKQRANEATMVAIMQARALADEAALQAERADMQQKLLQKELDAKKGADQP